MEDKTDNWRRLEKDVDLYKFYIGFLLKIAAFALGLTGAIVSYYLAHRIDHLMVYSLLLPLLVNVGLFILCSISIRLADELRQQHYLVCEELNIGFFYEMSPLSNLLRLFSIMYALIAIGIALLFGIGLSTGGD